MSTVTLSKPHCAMTSAEKPEGIASQAFTTTLPCAQSSLTLFAIVPASFLDFSVIASEAKQSRIFLDKITLDCSGFGDPRKDKSVCRCPLDARLAHADFACGIDDCRPRVVRQGHAVFGALGAHLRFRLARDQHLVYSGCRFGVLEIIDIARHLRVEEIRRVDNSRIDIESEHAVGQAPGRSGRTGAGQRATEQFADQRKTRALVLAKCT